MEHTEIERKRFFTAYVIPIILALTAVLSTLYFQYKTALWTEERAYRVLATSAQEQTATLNEIFNGRFSILETFANSLANQLVTPKLEDITTRMTAIVDASDFENLAVAKTDGIAYTNDGLVSNSSDRFYMTEALSGRRAIEKLTDSRLYEKSRLVLSVPLYINGEVSGVVMGSFSDSEVQKLLISSAFEGSAYSFLSDPSGRIVVTAEAPLLMQGTDNLFEKFANMELLNGTTVEGIEYDLQNGCSGVAAYSLGKETRYAVYQPTGINNWYIFSVVPGSVMDREVAAQRRLGMTSICVVALCAILLLIILAQSERRRTRELKKLQEAQLVRYRTDPITGLLNGQGFTQAVEETLRTLSEHQFCAMIDFGILNFNQYNVSFGSTAGDAVLRGAANTLLAHCRVTQPCARLSGDRFACFATGCADQQELLKRIVSLDKKLHAPKGTHQLQMAYGVYIVTDRTLPVEEICTRAVAARLTVDMGKHNIGIYDHVIHQQQIEDAQLLASMDEGLRLGQFISYYQPKYNAHTERIVGAEALVRWLRPDGEVKPPARFIQLFEQNGLITKLDLYMFELVCQKLAAMDEPVPVSVNFSRAHLYDTDFPDKLLKIAEKHGAKRSLLEIELTETAFFDQRDALIQNMDRLRELGFLVSIDDFGSGYSSLNLLKDMRFDIVKLDKEFFSEATQTERGRCVVKSVLALADSLRVHTVAEGVETREQLDFLRENGCDIIQGYYFSRPISEAEFDRLLQAQKKNPIV